MKKRTRMGRSPVALRPWMSLFLAVCGLFLAVTTRLPAQDKKLIFFGAGVSRDSTGPAYSFGLTFNRTEAAESEPAIALWSHPTARGIWILTPSAEANLGNGVEASANNVIVASAIEYWQFRGTTGQRLSLAPTIAADKNFKTGVFYGRVGGEIVTYNNPNYPRYFAVAGLAVDAGRRATDSAASTNFIRLVPHVGLNYSLRTGLRFDANAKWWQIAGDETVIKNGGYGLVKAALDYRFPKGKSATSSKPRASAIDPYEEPEFGPVGISVEYGYGFDEPLFVRQHVVTLGVAFYRR